MSGRVKPPRRRSRRSFPARAVGLGIVSPDEIDRINILQATLLAMGLAVERLKVPADALLIDGITPLPTTLPLV